MGKVFSSPDLSGCDLNTFEGRREALERLLGYRDEEGYAMTADITSLDPELLEYIADDGVETLVVRFRPQEWMLNSFRCVQEGFLAAMIDVVCGPLSAVCSGEQIAGTLDMNLTFFRPVTMDDDKEITVRARMTSITKRVMYFECELLNRKGRRAVSAVTNILRTE